jgi:hypothetical protein
MACDSCEDSVFMTPERRRLLRRVLESLAAAQSAMLDPSGERAKVLG